jgi:osmoprotectant transport system ATP-binding protein
MIELDNLVKVYNGRTVVDGMSLTIDQGEFCALIGPSGCGKSTTLKMINRMVSMTSGTVRIDGEDVAGLPAEILRRRIGYVIQSVGLFPHWTVEDNIATVPRLLKWPESKIRGRIDELLDMVSLDPAVFAKRYPDQLSGGQQQRVGVARALAADPELLLMDEPFGALDPITRAQIHTELTRIHRVTGKTIVMVTQDMEEAVRLADKIAVMRDGKLVQAGPPIDILERPSSDFVVEFFGRSQLGIAVLSAKRVGDAVKPGTAPGQPISAEASLRDALSEMLIRHADALTVSNDTGEMLGIIALADIVA